MRDWAAEVVKQASPLSGGMSFSLNSASIEGDAQGEAKGEAEAAGSSSEATARDVDLHMTDVGGILLPRRLFDGGASGSRAANAGGAASAALPPSPASAPVATAAAAHEVQAWAT